MNQLTNSIEIKKSNKFIDYQDSIKFMRNRVDEILNKKEKELIWFLKYNHIYTCGTSSEEKDIINKNTNIPIIHTNRGGKITYHGPGQRIIYFVIDLNKRKKDVRKFVSLIEETLITLLSEFNIEAKSFSDRVGIWVISSNGLKLPKEKKIGAIGLRITKWITYHGLSFNINPDLSYYNDINSCGLSNFSNISLKELNIKILERKFDQLFIDIFTKKLECF